MALGFKFLKKNSPGLKLIVSFADPNEGHHGGIYQATNWVYTGKSSKTFKYLDFNGREWHSRQVSEKGYKVQQGKLRKTVKPSHCKKILCDGKHRYLMPLEDEMKKKIEPLRKPYPKRASSVESGTSPVQGERGGESPTDALQSEKSKGR